MCDAAELIYSFGGIEPIVTWTTIWQLIPHEDRAARPFQFNDREVPAEKILGHVRKLRGPFFGVEGGGWKIELAGSEDSDASCLFVKHQGRRAISSWDEWVGTLASNKRLMLAYVYDSEYEFWQNAYDPLQYQARGRSYTGLPMKSNGLPYPLEQQIIDTSNNPGRRVWRKNYVEAVGAVMWLGPLFFERTGANLADVNGHDDIQINRQWQNDIVRIQAGDHCFKSADGRDGELQNILRRALFPQSP